MTSDTTKSMRYWSLCFVISKNVSLRTQTTHSKMTKEGSILTDILSIVLPEIVGSVWVFDRHSSDRSRCHHRHVICGSYQCRRIVPVLLCRTVWICRTAWPPRPRGCDGEESGPGWHEGWSAGGGDTQTQSQPLNHTLTECSHTVLKPVLLWRSSCDFRGMFHWGYFMVTCLGH